MQLESRPSFHIHQYGTLNQEGDRKACTVPSLHSGLLLLAPVHPSAMIVIYQLQEAPSLPQFTLPELCSDDGWGVRLTFLAHSRLLTAPLYIPRHSQLHTFAQLLLPTCTAPHPNPSSALPP